MKKIPFLRNRPKCFATAWQLFLDFIERAPMSKISKIFYQKTKKKKYPANGCNNNLDKFRPNICLTSEYNGNKRGVRQQNQKKQNFSSQNKKENLAFSFYLKPCWDRAKSSKSCIAQGRSCVKKNLFVFYVCCGYKRKAYLLLKFGAVSNL